MHSDLAGFGRTRAMRRACVGVAVCVMGIQLAACGESRPESSMDMPAVTRNDASLFPADAAVLPDSVVDRILRYRVMLPSRVRIAVLQLGGRRSRWDGGNAAVNRLIDSTVHALRQLPRAGAVQALPELLLPEKFTMVALREAAARFQSDLLVVYRPECDSYARTPMLRANQWRALCRIDLLLLDVRSGVIPFSTAGSAEGIVTQEKDATRSEMLLAAESASLLNALAALKAPVRDYLAAVDTLRVDR